MRDGLCALYAHKPTLVTDRRDHDKSTADDATATPGRGFTTNGGSPLQSSDRRKTLERLVATCALVSLATPSLSSAADPAETTQASTTTVVDEPDFACLADLGPIPDDAVRIYLCRHGQTENNRLRLVQGSRMNPPLNDNGRQQAQRLGRALQQAAVPPSALYHSPLDRARQTAEIAAAQFDVESMDVKDNDNNDAQPTTTTTTRTGVLESIREIDFGPTADGTKVKQAQQQMTVTYAQWAFGRLHVKMASDGESGKEVCSLVASMSHGHQYARVTQTLSLFCSRTIGIEPRGTSLGGSAECRRAKSVAMHWRCVTLEFFAHAARNGAKHFLDASGQDWREKCQRECH